MGYEGERGMTGTARKSAAARGQSPSWRRAKDIGMEFVVRAGGVSVLFAILMIFAYLIYVISPLLASATAVEVDPVSVGQLSPLYVTVDEQVELGFTIDSEGAAGFVRLVNGKPVGQTRVPHSSSVTAVAADSPNRNQVAVALRSGEVDVLGYDFGARQAGIEATLAPQILYPFNDPVPLGEAPLRRLALLSTEEGVHTLVGQQVDGTLQARRFVPPRDADETSGWDALRMPALPPLEAIYLVDRSRWLVALDRDANYWVLDLRNTDSIAVVDRGRLFDPGDELLSSAMLLGELSLIAGSRQGELAQYFVVLRDSRVMLERVRSFPVASSITNIYPEQRRKGFATLDTQGALQLYHSTSRRDLLPSPLSLAATAVSVGGLAPRGDALLFWSGGEHLRRIEITNQHPEISWSSLWLPTWYESYDAPEFIWQSSASDVYFESKYSLAPLAFGTLKAAFYTMLLAAPLAICGAIYTAYFMAPALRRKIKPLIELMEALPTVILGFLAGLWLAPLVERYLAGVLATLVLLPVGVLAFAYLWHQLPRHWTSRIPVGWDALILVPVVLVLVWLALAGGAQFEALVFGGDTRGWLASELGIGFDQRNALVVGVAMGMAVTPSIFTIAEDALFSVPKTLSDGSLALGATRWQTLVGVVLPMASPGIFSGLMIGLGRAVGETMIVLMATGNTPIMDANLFEGMRTLAANIAVEVPEAAVDSTHYRVLFLAAFVLFAFTFVVNTAAEVVRQRLRQKYRMLS